jgi:hypothetical protein
LAAQGKLVYEVRLWNRAQLETFEPLMHWVADWFKITSFDLVAEETDA